MIKCPYCGGTLVTIGGGDGNPFNVHQKIKTVCSECGRKISEHSDDILDYVKAVISITLTAIGNGVTITAEKTVPFENGTYFLGSEYPFSRRYEDENRSYSFENITVNNDEITVAGETVKIGEKPVKIVKHFQACAYDKHPIEEKIVLTISKDIIMK